jgi:hypothetical protein
MTPFIPLTPCPFQGAPVQIISGGALVTSTTTDASGFYKVSGLVPGKYTAKITIPGYIIYNLTNITVTAGTESTGNDIKEIYRYSTTTIRVNFNAGASQDAINALISSLGCTLLYTYAASIISIPAGAMPPDVVAEFQASPLVSSASLGYYQIVIAL